MRPLAAGRHKAAHDPGLAMDDRSFGAGGGEIGAIAPGVRTREIARAPSVDFDGDGLVVVRVGVFKDEGGDDRPLPGDGFEHGLILRLADHVDGEGPGTLDLDFHAAHPLAGACSRTGIAEPWRADKSRDSLSLTSP